MNGWIDVVNCQIAPIGSTPDWWREASVSLSVIHATIVLCQ
jgi:hypothetical protein